MSLPALFIVPFSTFNSIHLRTHPKYLMYIPTCDCSGFSMYVLFICLFLYSHWLSFFKGSLLYSLIFFCPPYFILLSCLLPKSPNFPDFLPCVFRFKASISMRLTHATKKIPTSAKVRVVLEEKTTHPPLCGSCVVSTWSLSSVQAVHHCQYSPIDHCAEQCG